MSRIELFTEDESPISSTHYDNDLLDFSKFALLEPRRYSDNGFFSAYVGDDAKKVMLSFHSERDCPNSTKIEDQLRIINKRYNYILKNKILDLYSSRRIMLIDNKTVFSGMMSSLVCWKMANSNGLFVPINATPYFNKDSIETIDTKTLFGLLCWGSMVYICHTEWSKITSNATIAQNLSYVYANLFYRIIDNITGIGIVKARKDFITYILSKYFLIYLLGRAPSVLVNNIAYRNVETISRNESAIPSTILAIESEEFRLGEFAGAKNQLELYRLKVPDFIQAIGKFEWAIGKLNARSFLAKAVSSYNQKIIFGIEDLGHFVGAMASHQAASELVTSYTIERSFDRYGGDAIAALAQLSY